MRKSDQIKSTLLLRLIIRIVYLLIYMSKFDSVALIYDDSSRASHVFPTFCCVWIKSRLYP